MGTKNISRRDFLKSMLQSGIVLATTKSLSFAAKKVGTTKKETKPFSVVAVAKNGTPDDMVRQTIDMLGGIKKFVSPGDIVVVKPNIGFDRAPELACTTNPNVIVEIVRLAFEAGAKKVKVFDRPCSHPPHAYKISGIEDAAKNAGAEVKLVDESKFIKTTLPNALVLKEWEIYKDILECDCLINVPIAKVHRLTKVSLGIKNYLGMVGSNRGIYHMNMGPWLADVGLLIKPKLVIIDAVRSRVRSGPSGGLLEDVEQWNTIAASTDTVAIDSYVTTLFKLKPEDISYIKESYTRNLGEMDLAKVKIEIKDLSKN